MNLLAKTSLGIEQTNTTIANFRLICGAVVVAYFSERTQKMFLFFFLLLTTFSCETRQNKSDSTQTMHIIVYTRSLTIMLRSPLFKQHSFSSFPYDSMCAFVWCRVYVYGVSMRSYMWEINVD